MCGRATHRLSWAEVVRLLRLTTDYRPNIEPNYNLAPTEDIWIETDEHGERALMPMRWWLVPSQAREIPITSRVTISV